MKIDKFYVENYKNHKIFDFSTIYRWLKIEKYNSFYIYYLYNKKSMNFKSDIFFVAIFARLLLFWGKLRATYARLHQFKRLSSILPALNRKFLSAFLQAIISDSIYDYKFYISRLYVIDKSIFSAYAVIFCLQICWSTTFISIRFDLVRKYTLLGRYLHVLHKRKKKFIDFLF